MHNIHVCLTQRSFIQHGGIQDDSFFIATQSLRRDDKNDFGIFMAIMKKSLQAQGCSKMAGCKGAQL